MNSIDPGFAVPVESLMRCRYCDQECRHSCIGQKLAKFTHFDIGCGLHPREGYHGLDKFDGSRRFESDTITELDLASGDPWPIADDQAEALSSSHFIEHVDAKDIEWSEYYDRTKKERSSTPTAWQRQVGTKDALAFVMDEAFRILKPGGIFQLKWPSLSRVDTGEICTAAFTNPTHRRFIPFQQLYVWNAPMREMLGMGHYGYSSNFIFVRGWQNHLTDIDPLGNIEVDVWENEAILRKPLPGESTLPEDVKRAQEGLPP